MQVKKKRIWTLRYFYDFLKLNKVVDSRYGVKAIILTSNRAISDWMSVFPDPVFAGALSRKKHAKWLQHISIRHKQQSYLSTRRNRNQKSFLKSLEKYLSL